MIPFATLFFALYTVISLAVFGIPDSLSQTHYLWRSKGKAGGVVFPLFLATFCTMLMPSALSLTEGSNWQFTAFVMVASLLFVAAAPAFLDDSQSKVHSVAAIISAIAGIAFTCAFGHWWVAVIFAVIGSMCAAIRPKSLVFFMEMAAFASVLVTLNTI